MIGKDLLNQMLELSAEADPVELVDAWPGAVDEDLVREVCRKVGGLVRRDARRAHGLARAGCAVARRLKDPAMLSRAHRALGFAEHALGRYREAVTAYETAVEGFTAVGDQVRADDTRVALADARMYLSEYDAALELCVGARERLLAAGRSDLAAKASWNEGNIHHRRDDYRAALRSYLAAREYFEREGNQLRVALVDLNRAVVLSMTNEYEEADALFRSAREALVEQGVEGVRAQLDYNHAYLFFLRGRHAEALAVLDELRDEFEQLGDHRHVALVDLDRSEILLRLNLSAEAEDHADSAAGAFGELGMHFEEGKARLTGALARLDRGALFEGAVALENAALGFFTEGNEVWAAIARVLQAEVLCRSGDYIDAHRLARDAEDVFAERGVPDRRAWARLIRAQAAHQLGDGEEAADLLDAVLKDPPARLEYRARQERGRILLAGGDRPGARREFSRAVELVEEMRNRAGGEELRTAFLADKTSVYEDAVLACLADGDVEEALAFVERSRSRALVELLVGRVARPPVREEDAELWSELASLRGDLCFLYERMAEFEKKTGERALGQVEWLRGELQRKEEEVGRVLRRIEVRNPELSALNAPREVPEAAGRLVEPGTTLLEYFALGDRTVVFLVRGGEVTVRDLPRDSGEIRQLADRLSHQFAKFALSTDYLEAHRDMLDRTVDGILEELHGALLSPVDADLGDDHLIVIPHGALHAVPFHALRDPDGASVLDRREVSYAPSASVLKLCLMREATGGAVPLVMGLRDETTPHIGDELDMLREVLPGAHVFSGPEATLANLERYAAEARVIHLASHGGFRFDNPAFSGIRLADTWLGLLDLYGLEIGAELVTLSACESGLSRARAGDELVGLARGLFYAGTPTLLASLWRVNDHSTAEFMKEFYRHWEAGRSPAESVRRAGLAVRESYRHPYFWAPFVVHGRPRGGPRRDLTLT